MEKTATEPGWLGDGRGPHGAGDALGLVVVWSLAEPDRVGDIARLPRGAREAVLGRGDAEDEPRVELWRERPGALARRPPLDARAISRRQLALQIDGTKLSVRRIGRRDLAINGVQVDESSIGPGDVVSILGQLVLLCVERPAGMFSQRVEPPTFAFGAPDADGIVGESFAAWVLRDRIAFAARHSAHVFVRGESGTGKELVARAIHSRSSRARGPFVSRNAATLPEGLVDAELFGNLKNYPNPGMRERDGLVGEAERGTLFLDEIGEIGPELQAHLLRLLDSGEYQRLGDATTRKSGARVIAATNRGDEAIKHDVLARLSLRVDVPSLGDRREDIPLLVRHLLSKIAREDPAVSARFFEADGTARLAPGLIEALLVAKLSGNVRDLSALLYESLEQSLEHYLDVPQSLSRRLKAAPRESAVLDERAIRAALERYGGSVTRAAQALGLRNRDVLYRLMKKHGIESK